MTNLRSKIWGAWFCLLILTLPKGAGAQVQGIKEGVSFPGNKFYGTFELRHHLNTFYDEQGYRGRQDPSAHARLQLGSQSYGGYLDAYVTLGVLKLPRTQQTLLRRPEAALDLYLLRHPNFSILQYNLIQWPEKRANLALQDEEKDRLRSSDLAYSAGLAPSAQYVFVLGAAKIGVKGGLDGWTNLYSRPQYTRELESDSHAEQLTLKEGESGASDSHEIEDYALHYHLQSSAGVGLVSSLAPSLKIDATLNYKSSFVPRYSQQGDEITHEYGAKRSSHYLLRTSLELTDRVRLVNDFYQFYGGLFAEKRRGEERRYRNILRLVCNL